MAPTSVVQDSGSKGIGSVCAWVESCTRKPCYRRDDRAMRPIYGRREKFRERLATPTANFPKIFNGLLL